MVSNSKRPPDANGLAVPTRPRRKPKSKARMAVAASLKQATIDEQAMPTPAVANLATMFGRKDGDARRALSARCDAVVARARRRKAAEADAN